MGKLSYEAVRIISFLGVISIRTKSVCLVTQHRLKICILYCEANLISMLLEVLCYQDTLTMNL